MIAFACIGCGSVFQGPETLAGKTVRCKRASQLMKVPEPQAETSPPTGQARRQPQASRPSRAQSPPDTDIYDLDDAASGPSRPRPGYSPAPVRPVSSAPAPFEPGQAIDLLKVEECDEGRLVLAMPTGWTILRVILGGVAMVLGIVLFVVMFSRINGGAQRPNVSMRFSVFGLMLPFLIFGLGAMNFSLLLKLGYRIAFDGPEGTFSLRHCYGWEESWPAEDLGGIVYIAHKTDERGTPLCEAIILDRNGTALGAFGVLGRRTDKPKEVLRIAKAAIQAATLLRIPVHVDALGDTAPEVRNAVRWIEASEPYRLGRGRPRVRYPFWSHKTIMKTIVGLMIVGLVVILGSLFLPDSGASRRTESTDFPIGLPLMLRSWDVGMELLRQHLLRRDIVVREPDLLRDRTQPGPWTVQSKPETARPYPTAVSDGGARAPRDSQGA